MVTFPEGKAGPRSENGLAPPQSNFGFAKKDRRLALVKRIGFSSLLIGPGNLRIEHGDKRSPRFGEILAEAPQTKSNE